MYDIIFDIIKVIVALLSIVFARYVIPWIKEKISNEQLDSIAFWVEQAVLYAQQVLTSATGEEKKAAVINFIEEILIANNITISAEQLNILIEAAVKAMKEVEGRD